MAPNSRQWSTEIDLDREVDTALIDRIASIDRYGSLILDVLKSIREVISMLNDHS
jgi:hypothetical protein